MRRVILLGPQRTKQTIRETIDSLDRFGTVAVVSAGWQEREPETDELEEHVGRRIANLHLYARAEELFSRDREFHDAYRKRQDKLQGIQRLYRLRLESMLDVARRLLARRGREGEAILEPEIDASISAVRQMDLSHLDRVRSVHSDFAEKWKIDERPTIREHRDALAKTLEGCSALLITGGHVTVLVNRLRLFGILRLLDDQPVVAWSAGAMALSDRIVLFHDSPPQGAGNAEVLEAGCSLAPGLVPLPHARHRLRLDDPVRVELFARRFAPALPLAMGDGSRIDVRGGRVNGNAEVRRLMSDGSVRSVEAA